MASNQYNVKTLPERIVYNVRNCVLSFTGREDILQDLHEAVQKNRENGDLTILGQTGVLTGFGGIGKTETVRKYVQDHKPSYGHILWINSETYSAARNSFFNIAALMNVIEFKTRDKKFKKDEDIIDEVYNFILKKPTIIVFDNADSLLNNDISTFLPRSLQKNRKNPAIVIISKNLQFKNHPLVALSDFVVLSKNSKWRKHHVIRLNGFTDSESYNLLSNQLKFVDNYENRSLALEIAHLADRLPLIIQQIVGVIQTETEERATLGEVLYTMQDFLKDYHETEKIDQIPEDKVLTHLDISLTVYKIFKLTFQKLADKKYGQLALKSLDIASLLMSDCIPAHLLLSIMSEEESASNTEAEKAMGLLTKYNLINISENSYSIHRMVQNVRIEMLKNGQNNQEGSQDQFGDLIVQISFGFTNFLKKMTLTTESKLDILENGIHFSKFAEMFDAQILDFLTELAAKLRENEKFDSAIILQKRILEVQVKDENYENIYEANKILAGCYVEQGQFKEAEESYRHLLALIDDWSGKLAHLYKNQDAHNDLTANNNKYFQVLQSKATNLGNGRYEDLETKSNLGQVYRMEKNFDEAESLYIEVLKTLETSYGLDNLANLIQTIKQELAIIYTRQKRFGEAEKLHTAVIAQQKATLGEDHPATLNTRAELAFIIALWGKYSKSQKLCKVLLPKQPAVMCRDYENALKLNNKLANIYEIQAKLDKAEVVLMEFAKQIESHFGKSHPNTLKSKHLLASKCMAHGKLEKAESLFKGILKQLETVLGKHHPDTLETKNFLAFIYNRQNKLKKIKQLDPDGLVEQKNADDHANESTWMSKHNLGTRYLSQGKFTEAEEILKDVLKAREPILGKYHPAVLSTKFNLASNYKCQGNFPKAEECLTAILKAGDEVLSSHRLDSEDVKDELFEIYFCQKKFDEAAELLEGMLEKLATSVGKDHLDTLRVRSNLALTYTHQERKAGKAEELLKEILEKKTAILGDNHHDTLDTQFSLAMVYLDIGKYGEAAESFKDVFQKRRITLGAQHPCTLMTLRLSVAANFHSQGEHDRAAAILDSSVVHNNFK